MRQGAMAGTASAVAAVLFLCQAADATQPRLRDVELRRVAAEADKHRLDNDVHSAAAAVGALNRKLVAVAAEQRAAEASVTALERQVGDLIDNERAANDAAAQSGAMLEHTLIALARTEGDPRLTPVATVAALVGRSQAAQALAAQRQAIAAQGARRELAERRAALAVAQARLDSKTAEIRTLMTEQQARQAIANADASKADARLGALIQQARNLRELVSRAAPVRAVSARPATTATRSALTRLTPAAGTVIRRFGDPVRNGTAQGMTVRTRPGAQVLAPTAGKVAYSGPFRSYGIVLILDLDNDYAVVLTGMDAVLANAGQRVLAGQPIAEMPAGATPAPELYVEVRRSGSPVDPARWLRAGG